MPSSVFRLPTGIESREVLRSVRRSSDGADLGTIAQRMGEVTAQVEAELDACVS